MTQPVEPPEPSASPSNHRGTRKPGTSRSEPSDGHRPHGLPDSGSGRHLRLLAPADLAGRQPYAVEPRQQIDFDRLGLRDQRAELDAIREAADAHERVDALDVQDRRAFRVVQARRRQPTAPASAGYASVPPARIRCGRSLRRPRASRRLCGRAYAVIVFVFRASGSQSGSVPA